MSAEADPADKSQYVQSLARGLSVIAAFDAAQPVMTLSDVARHTGLTRATARRFLLTLESLGYVRSDGRMFELTPRVLQLGYSYLSALSLPQIASPHLKRLSDTLQESTSMSVLDGQDIVYVARVATHRIMTVAIAVGTRFPAYATSMGRVLLAGLSAKELGEYLSTAELSPLTRRTTTERVALAQQLHRVRELGYAVVDQELEVGLRSAAVPVRDLTGRTVAAINVSMRVGMPGVDTDHPESQVIPELLACAGAIAQDLAASGR